MIGDLIGKPQPAIGFGVKAVQRLGGKEELECPSAACEAGLRHEDLGRADGTVGDGPRNGPLVEINVHALPSRAG